MLMLMEARHRREKKLIRKQTPFSLITVFIYSPLVCGKKKVEHDFLIMRINSFFFSFSLF